METAAVEPSGHVRATVRVPGSRSITNRALVLAALADGESRLGNWGDCDDTRVMAGGLRRLGVGIDVDADVLAVRGGRPLTAPPEPIDVRASGTTMRFLTAVATLASGVTTLDGTRRMRQRPIGDLADALNELGAQVETDGGTPPVRVAGPRLTGGEARVAAGTSSQFLSAVLMVAPRADEPVVLHVGDLVSRPFVDMTLAVLAEFGVEVAEQDSAFVVQPQPLTAATVDIEPDAMSAGYFLAAAAITGGDVTVPGLGAASLQGDAGFAHVLGRMGATVHQDRDGTRLTGPPKLRGIDVDMNAMPDSALTLAVVAAFATEPSRIRNVANLAVKESDRITALATELRKLGAAVTTHPDGLTIEPPAATSPARISTYDDHRIAMSFAIAGLATAGGVVIEDPGCAAKTYPRFFADLADAQLPR